MLRGVVVVLLLANALALAWAQGWLAPLLPAPGAAQREPERLAQQLNPDRVRVLPASAASSALAAARAAARVCLESGPVQEAQLPAAEAALVQAGMAPGSWVRGQPFPGQAPGVWLRLTQLDGDQQARLRSLQDPALPAAFQRCDAPR